MSSSAVSEKPEILSKSDIVSLVSEGMSLSKVDVERVVDKLFSTIESQMAQKKEVRIYGFGVFSAQHRKERTAFNPRTREKIEVPEQWVPKFRALDSLKKSVNHQ